MGRRGRDTRLNVHGAVAMGVGGEEKWEIREERKQAMRKDNFSAHCKD